MSDDKTLPRRQSVAPQRFDVEQAKDFFKKSSRAGSRKTTAQAYQPWFALSVDTGADEEGGFQLLEICSDPRPNGNCMVRKWTSFSEGMVWGQGCHRFVLTTERLQMVQLSRRNWVPVTTTKVVDSHRPQGYRMIEMEGAKLAEALRVREGSLPAPTFPPFPLQQIAGRPLQASKADARKRWIQREQHVPAGKKVSLKPRSKTPASARTPGDAISNVERGQRFNAAAGFNNALCLDRKRIMSDKEARAEELEVFLAVPCQDATLMIADFAKAALDELLPDGVASIPIEEVSASILPSLELGQQHTVDYEYEELAGVQCLLSDGAWHAGAVAELHGASAVIQMHSGERLRTKLPNRFVVPARAGRALSRKRWRPRVPTPPPCKRRRQHTTGNDPDTQPALAASLFTAARIMEEDEPAQQHDNVTDASSSEGEEYTEVAELELEDDLCWAPSDPEVSPAPPVDAERPPSPLVGHATPSPLTAPTPDGAEQADVPGAIWLTSGGAGALEPATSFPLSQCPPFRPPPPPTPQSKKKVDPGPASAPCLWKRRGADGVAAMTAGRGSPGNLPASRQRGGGAGRGNAKRFSNSKGRKAAAKQQQQQQHHNALGRPPPPPSFQVRNLTPGPAHGDRCKTLRLRLSNDPAGQQSSGPGPTNLNLVSAARGGNLGAEAEAASMHWIVPRPGTDTAGEAPSSGPAPPQAGPSHRDVPQLPPLSHALRPASHVSSGFKPPRPTPLHALPPHVLVPGGPPVQPHMPVGYANPPANLQPRHPASGPGPLMPNSDSLSPGKFMPMMPGFQPTSGPPLISGPPPTSGPPPSSGPPGVDPSRTPERTPPPPPSAPPAPTLRAPPRPAPGHPSPRPTPGGRPMSGLPQPQGARSPGWGHGQMGQARDGGGVPVGREGGGLMVVEVCPPVSEGHVRELLAEGAVEQASVYVETDHTDLIALAWRTACSPPRTEWFFVRGYSAREVPALALPGRAAASSRRSYVRVFLSPASILIPPGSHRHGPPPPRSPLDAHMLRLKRGGRPAWPLPLARPLPKLSMLEPTTRCHPSSVPPFTRHEASSGLSDMVAEAATQQHSSSPKLSRLSVVSSAFPQEATAIKVLPLRPEPSRPVPVTIQPAAPVVFLTVPGAEPAPAQARPEVPARAPAKRSARRQKQVAWCDERKRELLLGLLSGGGLEEG